jgi:PRTRC genetic system protein A
METLLDIANKIFKGGSMILGKNKNKKNKNWFNKHKEHSHFNDKKGKKMGYDAAYLRQSAELDNKESKNTSNFKSTYVAPAKAPAPTCTPEETMFIWDYLNDVQFGVLKTDALTKLNTWFIAGNGKWLIQKNKALFAGLKKSNEGIPTLPESKLSNAFISLTYGKIPQEILNQIVAFFRAVMAKHGGSEAFCQVYWDLQESKYVVHVPSQVVSGAAVRYDATKNLDKSNPERYVFVYECHSHNSMSAFWSGTDNADENDLRVYGVFGKLNNEKWEHKQRTIVGEQDIDVPLELIFDIRETEPQYLITINPETVVTVAQSAITVDETPRYNVKLSETETVAVEQSQIRKIDVRPSFPSNWLEEVNTPPARAQVQTTYQSQYQSRNWSGGSHLMPKHDASDEVDPVTGEVTGPGEDDPAGFELLAHDVVEQIEDLTNGFEDAGTSVEFFEALEARRLLYPLKNQLLAYLGEFEALGGTEEDYGSESTDSGTGNEDDESVPAWLLPQHDTYSTGHGYGYGSSLV